MKHTKRHWIIVLTFLGYVLGLIYYFTELALPFPPLVVTVLFFPFVLMNLVGINTANLGTFFFSLIFTLFFIPILATLLVFGTQKFLEKPLIKNGFIKKTTFDTTPKGKKALLVILVLFICIAFMQSAFIKLPLRQGIKASLDEVTDTQNPLLKTGIVDEGCLTGDDYCRYIGYKFFRINPAKANQAMQTLETKLPLKHCATKDHRIFDCANARIEIIAFPSYKYDYSPYSKTKERIVEEVRNQIPNGEDAYGVFINSYYAYPFSPTSYTPSSSEGHY